MGGERETDVDGKSLRKWREKVVRSIFQRRLVQHKASERAMTRTKDEIW